MIPDIEQISSPRLTGECLGPRHLGQICRLHRDPVVMRTLSADGLPVADEITARGLIDAEEHWRAHGFGLWAFFDTTDGEFVGRGGLKVYSIDGAEVIGLAYAVVSERFGQGFATEMARASLSVGFDRLGFECIDSWTLPINLASQRVMAKLGYQYQRDFTFAGLPHRYYRLNATDWHARGE